LKNVLLFLIRINAMNMKKFVILNIFCLLLFCWLGNCIESDEDSFCYDEDKALSKTNSLISGICFDRFIEQPPMAAITVGFNDVHAYLVFELPEKGKNGTVIKIQGVHFSHENDGYVDMCFDDDNDKKVIAQAICGSGSPLIRFESPDAVIKKFVRKRTIKTNRKRDNYKVLEFMDETEESMKATYSKTKSFVVTNAMAEEALELAKKDKRQKKVRFSVMGWYPLSPNSFNCCTYAARLLRAAGISIKDKDYNHWVKDRQYLKEIIKQYEERNKALGDGVEILNPLPAEELIDLANKGNKPLAAAPRDPAAAMEEREPKMAGEVVEPRAAIVKGPKVAKLLEQHVEAIAKASK
jgi:hypothetical protein